jgi:hypothetical protein
MMGWVFSSNDGNRSACRILVQQRLLERPTGRPKRKAGLDNDFKIVSQTQDREFVLFLISVNFRTVITKELITNSDPRRTALLEKPIIHQQVRKFLTFIEAEVSLSYSQQ